MCHTLKTCIKKLSSHQKAALSFRAALLNNSRHQNHSPTPNANFGLIDFSEKIIFNAKCIEIYRNARKVLFPTVAFCQES
jgi:hypothetical protein